MSPKVYLCHYIIRWVNLYIPGSIDGHCMVQLIVCFVSHKFKTCRFIIARAWAKHFTPKNVLAEIYANSFDVIHQPSLKVHWLILLVFFWDTHAPSVLWLCPFNMCVFTILHIKYYDWVGPTGYKSGMAVYTYLNYPWLYTLCVL